MSYFGEKHYINIYYYYYLLHASQQSLEYSFPDYIIY